MSYYVTPPNVIKTFYDFYDLDILIYDSSKIIHIATAGMPLINSLNSIKFDPVSNFRRILRYRRIFEFETAPSIDRNNLSSIENYTNFFNYMALRGFYSYDKINIDNQNNFNFQLISKPNYDRRISIPQLNIVLGNLDSSQNLDYNLNFIQARRDFPDDFESFDIREYI